VCFVWRRFVSLEETGHEIEEVLLNWIDMGYDPENYTQAQLKELDSLTGYQAPCRGKFQVQLNQVIATQ
jgi:hypothetical protein